MNEAPDVTCRVSKGRLVRHVPFYITFLFPAAGMLSVLLSLEPYIFFSKQINKSMYLLLKTNKQKN